MEFMEWATEPNQAATADDTFTPSRTDSNAVFSQETEFYTALYTWYRTNVGARYRGSILWASEACNLDGNADAVPAGCTLSEGLKASRFNAELSLAATNRGTDPTTP